MFVCMHVCMVCIYVSYAGITEESSGMSVGCEMLSGCRELNLSPPREQLMSSNTEPPLQTLLPPCLYSQPPFRSTTAAAASEIFVRLRLSGQQQQKQSILKASPSHWRAGCSPASVLVNREQIGSGLKLRQEDLQFEASLGYMYQKNVSNK